ncbi:MAG: U32 family peptidase [Gammaproteobacteria bacterium]|nr:MAG: U32 family peptidase [Gammaproteobacteria bacterium]
MELVTPAGNLPSLKAAVDNGADSVYIGFKDDTNARHFAGLNFDDNKSHLAISYARDRGVKVFAAINTYPQPSNFNRWQNSVDMAADIGVDAIILADMGVMEYACKKHPDLHLHLSVQGSATTAEAINFYHKNFAIKRVVIPRVLSIKQVGLLIKKSLVPIETFGFGSLCVMVEGRCLLSSYVTGQSPNTYGACSPASFVKWVEKKDMLETRLNDVLIDKYKDDETAGYPTICKGRFKVSENTYYAMEEPTSLNTLDILPELFKIGVSAIKIEGRQRSPAYVAQVTKVWRQAIDSVKNNYSDFIIKDNWQEQLQKVSEGTSTTLGAYSRPWQ